MRTCVKSALVALAVVGLLAGVTGCTTAKSSEQKVERTAALACPECKSVTLGPFQTSGAWRGEPPATITKHECSGCRGVINLRREGEQFRHECSVCKQVPFSCEATHTP